jgi:hypothetical protein
MWTKNIGITRIGSPTKGVDERFGLRRRARCWLRLAGQPVGNEVGMWTHFQRHPGEPVAIIAALFLVVNLSIDLTVRNRTFGDELSPVILFAGLMLVIAIAVETATSCRRRRRSS